MLRAVLINCSFFLVPIPVLNVKNEFPAWSVCENLDSIFYAPRLAATRQLLFLFCFLCFFGSKSQEDKKDKKDKDKDKDKKDKKDKEDTSAEFFCGEITNNKPPNICPMG